MAPTAAGDLPAGTVWNRRYEVVRCIKSGGMGAVYEVSHLHTRRRCALKVMLPELFSDPDLRARFRQEASVTADIQSQHIVLTLDADVDSETGAPFIVMELLHGEDLGAALKRRGRLPAHEVVELLRQAALALDKTHAAGVVHRDLKPENLFLTKREDGADLLKVLDFGVAKIVARSTESAETTLALGTSLYMSPEQFHGDGAIGTRADLYSLAHVAFTLLVGEAYWKPVLLAKGRASLRRSVMRGLSQAATARAAQCGVDLPGAFDAWFAKTTAVDPADRFGSASVLVAELARALDIPLSAREDSEGPLALAPAAKAAAIERGAALDTSIKKRLVVISLGLIIIIALVLASKSFTPARRLVSRQRMVAFGPCFS
jgi:eukaryotic-like serine/threonine-protein kinase